MIRANTTILQERRRRQIEGLQTSRAKTRRINKGRSELPKDQLAKKAIRARQSNSRAEAKAEEEADVQKEDV